MGLVRVSYTGLSPSVINLSRLFYYLYFLPCFSPTTPTLPGQGWFGLVRVRSPLLAESLLFSFPPGT